MASFTFTNTTINYNSSALAAFKNNDSILLNDSTLIIDSDNRWGYNGSVFSVLQIGAATGGAILIDGTKVWEIPFSFSTGIVPSLSSFEASTTPVIGMTSGAYGELLGIWDTTSLVPLQSAVSLPQTGILKLRSKNGNFISGEDIKLSNGSTVTINTPGNRSWLNVTGRAGGGINTSSLVSYISANGDWYYLESTNGLHNQVFKIPVADNINGLWIESAPNTGVYDHWMHASTTWGQRNPPTQGSSFVYGTLSANGRIFTCDPSNGTVTIAYSGTDGMFGYLPPTGCKVRVPNIFLSNSGNGTPITTPLQELNTSYGLHSQNVLPVVGYRFKIYSTTLQYKFKNANINWEIGNAQVGVDAKFEIENCGLIQPLRFDLSDSIKIYNCILSPSKATNLNNYGNGTLKRVHIVGCNNLDVNNFSALTCTASALAVGVPLAKSAGLFQIEDTGTTTIKNCYSIIPTFLLDTAETHIYINTNTESMFLENITTVGSSSLTFNNSKNIVLKNFYASQGIVYPLNISTPYYTALLLAHTSNVLVDGVYCVPQLDTHVTDTNNNTTSFHKQLVQVQAICNDIEIRNVGTRTTPLTTFTGSQDYGVFPSIHIIDAFDIKLRNIHLVTQKLFRNITSSGVVGRQSKNILLENVYNYPSSFRNMTGNATNTNKNFEDVSYRNCTLRSVLGVPVSSTAAAPFSEVSGTHWQSYFTTTSTGYIYLQGNRPSTETAPYVTLISNPTGSYQTGFTGDGKVNLPNLGDNIVWEASYWFLGHTGFSNTIPVIRGSNTANLSATFQYDITTNGYNGSWLTLNSQNLSSIVVDPAVGIRLKIKLQTINTNSSNSFWSLYLTTKTDSESQQTQYPLPKTNNGIIYNIIPNSRVQIYNEDKDTELYNGVHSEIGDFTYHYNIGEGIDTGDRIRARITYVDGVTAKLRQELKSIATPTGFTFFADQEDDTIYNQNAVNGDLVTEFSADYPSIQVDISDPDQQTSIPRLYAWWVANEHTANGIAYYFGGVLAEDFANYRVLTSIVGNFKLDNLSNQGVVFSGNYRLYRDDGQVPVVTSTTGGGSIILYAGNVNITTVDRFIPSLTTQETNILNKLDGLQVERLNNTATIASVGQQLADALNTI